MTRNRQVLAIVFTRAEDRRRDESPQPLAISVHAHAARDRKRERVRKGEREEGGCGWPPLNEDRKNRAVRLFNIQGWSVAAARCVSRCHCCTSGPLQRNDNLSSFILRSELRRFPLLLRPSFRREYYRTLPMSLRRSPWSPTTSSPSFRQRSPRLLRWLVKASPCPRATTASTVIVALEFSPVQLPGKWFSPANRFSDNRCITISGAHMSL